MKKASLLSSYHSLKNVTYTFAIYLVGLAGFTLFRLLLLIQNGAQLQHLPKGETPTLLAQALFMGFRFDTTISGYLLAIPFLLLSISVILKWEKTGLYRFVTAFISIIYTLAFLICAMDVSWFFQFFSRLTMAVFHWADSPIFVGKMVFGDFQLWWVLLPWAIISWSFHQLNQLFLKKILSPQHPHNQPLKKHLFFTIGSFLLFGGLLFLGIRGRISKKSPIRVGTAYFSNYAFPNKLGLNPVFTLLRSYLDGLDETQREAHFMNNEIALKQVKTYLNISENADPTLARKIEPDSFAIQKPNVVLILMESMTAAKMGHFGNPDHLTSFLDSLAQEGLFYNNFYTIGQHTFSGIYSTLFSFPTIRRQHPLKGVEIPKYTGIASALKSHGYHNIYFTTHDEQFDNVSGFLKANDFDEVIAQKDFPSEKIVSTLGVPDDFLFEFSIPILNKITQENNPFLAVFMTASDHLPYHIPPYFKPKNTVPHLQIVEYADWSLRQFLHHASTQPWFERTLFVFLADHGRPWNVVYDLPLSFHHSPLLFYAPKFLKTPQQRANLASQLDVFPTIMGLLNLPYTNETFGIDLAREQRPFVFFNANDKYGVLNERHFYISRETGTASIYNYSTHSVEDILETHPILADSMKTYAESMFQAAQVLVKNKTRNGN